MTRLILYTLFFFLFYFFLRLLFKGWDGRKLTTASKKEPEELVQDPFCRTYISKRMAVRKKIRGQDYYFCSEKCLKNYIEDRNSR
jgi:uncharacterized protein